MPNKHYDIVIAGGGMVGISLILALASNQDLTHLSIAIVDASAQLGAKKTSALEYHPSFDSRSTALSLSSIDFYKKLGLWQKLQQFAEPIKTIHVSDRGHVGNALLENSDYDSEYLGAVVENAWMGKVLLCELEEFKQIECFHSTTVSDIKAKRKGYELQLVPKDTDQSTFEISSDLLIIADGSDSALLKRIGINVAEKNYDQKGIVANVELQLPHNGIAFERFTGNGAIAFLPLVGESGDLESRRMGMVWTLPETLTEDYITDTNTMSKKGIALLQTLFGYRMGQVQKVGTVMQYDLKRRVSKEVIRRNLVVMGNAAHTLHPVAGQGFNLALRDVCHLVSVLAEAVKNDESFSSLNVLEYYESLISRDKNITVGFSDGLIRLFGNNALPVQLARSIGLLGLDVSPFLKRQFIHQMTGMNNYFV